MTAAAARQLPGRAAGQKGRRPVTGRAVLRWLSVPRLLHSDPVRRLVGPLRPGQVAAITFGFWAAVALGVGWLWSSDESVEPPAPVAVPKQDRLIDRQRARQDPTLQELLLSARGVMGAVSGLQITSSDPPLTVTYSARGGSPRLLLRADGKPDQGVEPDGTVMVKNGDCWRRDGSADAPDAASLILPLTEPSVRFGKLQREDGLQVAPFTARALGAYGPGRGELRFDEDAVPVSFSYTPRSGAAFDAEVTFTAEAELLDFTPVC